jgi:hypothetical protein
MYIYIFLSFLILDSDVANEISPPFLGRAFKQFSPAVRSRIACDLVLLEKWNFCTRAYGLTAVIAVESFESSSISQ